MRPKKPISFEEFNQCLVSKIICISERLHKQCFESYQAIPIPIQNAHEFANPLSFSDPIRIDFGVHPDTKIISMNQMQPGLGDGRLQAAPGRTENTHGRMQVVSRGGLVYKPKHESP